MGFFERVLVLLNKNYSLSDGLNELNDGIYRTSNETEQQPPSPTLFRAEELRVGDGSG